MPFNYTPYHSWGTRWLSWLMHSATSLKVTGSIPDGVIIFPAALWPLADNFTTFMGWLSLNLGASASWKPQGLYKGSLFHIIIITNINISYYRDILVIIVVLLSVSRSPKWPLSLRPQTKTVYAFFLSSCVLYTPPVSPLSLSFYIIFKIYYSRVLYYVWGKAKTYHKDYYYYTI